MSNSLVNHPWSRLACALLGAVAGGCAVGDGEGRVSGVVTVVDCELEDSRFELAPTFFGAQAFEDLLDIRVQRGSDFEDRRDGIVVSVRSASEVATELLGVPISVRDEEGALARMTFYLNETCPIDFTGNQRPVVMGADQGVLVFDEIYAPELDDSARSIAARFQDVHFSDPSEPEGREALLSGSFRFIFNRGRPAQRFP